MNTDPERAWLMRVGEPTEAAQCNIEWGGGWHGRKRSGDFGQAAIWNVANEFRGDVEILRRAPEQRGRELENG